MVKKGGWRMNILLADSDRDFLQCYQKLLTMDGHTVTTAFDGAQTLSLLGPEKYDIAILQKICGCILCEIGIWYGLPIHMIILNICNSQ